MCGALSVVALFDSFHLIYDANEMRRKMKRKNHKKGGRRRISARVS
jgi:hypothetical protein